MFCPKCLKEMYCKKTGVTVRWRKEYAKSGDLFACRTCDNQVIKLAQEGRELRADIVGPYVYEVDE